jgi:hypothetical protein
MAGQAMRNATPSAASQVKPKNVKVTTAPAIPIGGQSQSQRSMMRTS